MARTLKEKEKYLLRKVSATCHTRKTVTKECVRKTVMEMGNIKHDINDISFYYELERRLNKELIGQEKNINKLIKSLIIKDSLKSKNIYSVLICGKRQTGKTLLANSLANYLKNDNEVIKIDLSDYRHDNMSSKLLGATAGYLGYDNKNNIFEKIRTSPTSVLVIDNFDLASSEIKRIFFNILENGYVEDATGKKIDFTNTIMIFTQTIDEEKMIGFSNKLPGDNKSDISSKVFLSIELDEIDVAKKLSIIINNIYNLTSDFSGYQVSITDDYKNRVRHIIENNSKDLGQIIADERRYILDIIVDNIMNNRNNHIISI